MNYCYLKSVSVIISFLFLYGCSYSDLTDLWSTPEDQEEVDGVVADASSRISGADENGTVEVESEPEGEE